MVSLDWIGHYSPPFANTLAVSDPDSVSHAIEEVIAKHGKIDNLVTSAGFTENFDAIAYPYDRVKKLWGGKRWSSLSHQPPN